MLASRLADIVPRRHVPLLVLRLPELERMAWRAGRPAARRLERRAQRIFAQTARRSLRAGDLIAHDAESKDFCLALAAPARSGGSIALPADCRATLCRMAEALGEHLEIDVESGWTVVTSVANGSLEDDKRAALERGLRERERFDFFSTVGHELRTPLTSIRGYLETLLDSRLDDATARRFLGIARSETLRLARLVDGMFDISLLDVRAALDVEARGWLGPAVEAALAALAPRAAERAVTIESYGVDDVSVAVGHDRLTQIVINVVANAIEHGRRGGCVAVTAVRLDRRLVRVDIDDDGPGIDAGEREAIFELGFRGAGMRTGGTGLGLALVRRLLDRAGGAVCAESSPLGGARIAIRLPLLDGEGRGVHDLSR